MNILLTEFAVLLLLVFAWCVTSPTVTDAAFQRHMDSGAFASSLEDAPADDEATTDAEEEDPFAFLNDLEDDGSESDESDEEEDPFAFLNDL